MGRQDEDKAWAAIGMALEHNWPSEKFTDGTEGAYRMTLGQYGADVVTAALERIVDRGVPHDAHPIDRKRRPSAPEIAVECKILLGRESESAEFDAPSWVEVLPVAERAAYRWLRNPPEGARFVREQLGDVAAAWFANGGREQILGANLGVDPYAAKNAADIGKGYDTFVATQRSRAAKGLTVTTIDAHGGLTASKLAQLGAGE